MQVNNLKLRSSFLQSLNIVNSIQKEVDNDVCNYKLIIGSVVDGNQGYYLSNTDGTKVSSKDIQFNNLIINVDVLKININNIQLFTEYYDTIDLPSNDCIAELFITSDSANKQLINVNRFEISSPTTSYYYVFFFNYFPRLKQLIVSGNQNETEIDVSKIVSLNADINPSLINLTMCNGLNLYDTTITGVVLPTSDGQPGKYTIDTPCQNDFVNSNLLFSFTPTENKTLSSGVLNSIVVNLFC